MTGFSCIAFVEYVLAEKILLDYSNLFSPNGYKKNDERTTLKINLTKDKPWIYTKKIDETSYLSDKKKQWFNEWETKKCAGLSITSNISLFLFRLPVVVFQFLYLLH